MFEMQTTKTHEAKYSGVIPPGQYVATGQLNSSGPISQAECTPTGLAAIFSSAKTALTSLGESLSAKLKLILRTSLKKIGLVPYKDIEHFLATTISLRAKCLELATDLKKSNDIRNKLIQQQDEHYVQIQNLRWQKTEAEARYRKLKRFRQKKKKT